MDSFMDLLLDFLFEAYAEIMTHIFPKKKVPFKYYRAFISVVTFFVLLGLVALLLLAFLMLSICGCSTEAQQLDAKNKLTLSVAPNLDATAKTVAIAHYQLKEGCREKLNVMYFVADNQEDMEPEQILINDLYFMDSDIDYSIN